MKRLINTLIVALIGGTGLFGQNWENVKVRSEQVGGNVYALITDVAGNIGVSVGDDGLLIVDDQFAPLAEKIKDALKSIDSGDLKFVLNTHWHGDHTDGNKVFGKEALIIAHSNVRKRLTTLQKTSIGDFPALPSEAWPVITFEQSVSIYFNGEEIRVIHLPKGHTDGDSVVYFVKSNVIHMGDHFFKDRFPYIDLASGGSVEGYKKNVASVIKMMPHDVKIIPGHGPVSNLDDLRRFHKMLQDSIDTVRDVQRNGRSIDDVKLPDEYESWGGGFINTKRWIETVFKSLQDPN